MSVSVDVLINVLINVLIEVLSKTDATGQLAISVNAWVGIDQNWNQ